MEASRALKNNPTRENARDALKAWRSLLRVIQMTNGHVEEARKLLTAIRTAGEIAYPEGLTSYRLTLYMNQSLAIIGNINEFRNKIKGAKLDEETERSLMNNVLEVEETFMDRLMLAGWVEGSKTAGLAAGWNDESEFIQYRKLVSDYEEQAQHLGDDLNFDKEKFAKAYNAMKARWKSKDKNTETKILSVIEAIGIAQNAIRGRVYNASGGTTMLQGTISNTLELAKEARHAAIIAAADETVVKLKDVVEEVSADGRMSTEELSTTKAAFGALRDALRDVEEEAQRLAEIADEAERARVKTEEVAEERNNRVDAMQIQAKEVENLVLFYNRLLVEVFTPSVEGEYSNLLLVSLLRWKPFTELTEDAYQYERDVAGSIGIPYNSTLHRVEASDEIQDFALRVFEMFNQLLSASTEEERNAIREGWIHDTSLAEMEDRAFTSASNRLNEAEGESAIAAGSEEVAEDEADAAELEAAAASEALATHTRRYKSTLGSILAFFRELIVDPDDQTEMRSLMERIRDGLIDPDGPPPPSTGPPTTTPPPSTGPPTTTPPSSTGPPTTTPPPSTGPPTTTPPPSTGPPTAPPAPSTGPPPPVGPPPPGIPAVVLRIGIDDGDIRGATRSVAMKNTSAMLLRGRRNRFASRTHPVAIFTEGQMKRRSPQKRSIIEGYGDKNLPLRMEITATLGDVPIVPEADVPVFQGTAVFPIVQPLILTIPRSMSKGTVPSKLANVSAIFNDDGRIRFSHSVPFKTSAHTGFYQILGAQPLFKRFPISGTIDIVITRSEVVRSARLPKRNTTGSKRDSYMFSLRYSFVDKNEDVRKSKRRSLVTAAELVGQRSLEAEGLLRPNKTLWKAPETIAQIHLSCVTTDEPYFVRLTSILFAFPPNATHTYDWYKTLEYL
jgi:hypothetical protein